MASESSCGGRKKYALGADVDKEVVFNFPYILQEDTASYIQDFGKVMFIIRGPPGTGKATLSEMICSKYPSAAFCCADSYFRNSFSSPERTKESLRASHEYCAIKAKAACVSNKCTIIVQNTHMKKWEMQPYLNFAAVYNYTVIMAITLYRYDVTPEALVANNTDGLDINYFRRRLRQWEDVPPLLTGWFLCPNDTLYIQNAALKCLEKLTGDGKFCRIFNAYDLDQIAKYFKVRNLLFCLAGYSTYGSDMIDYYLKPEVQDVYGKFFTITILGYHVTCSNLNAIVHVNEEMKPRIFEGVTTSFDLSDRMGAVEINNNIFEFGKTGEFPHAGTPEKVTVTEEDWGEDEEIDVSKSTFIHIGQRNDDLFNIGKIRKEFQTSLCSAANANDKINNSSFIELENETKVCRIQENEWLVKADKKTIIKTIFTGLYP